MVNKEYIANVINIIYDNNSNLLLKCGRKQIQNRLNKLTNTEKRNLLDNKLNPVEWKRYDYYTKDINHINEIFNKIDEYPDENIMLDSSFYNDKKSLIKELSNRLKRDEDKIYQYERRIFSDYTINKNPIPVIDKSLYSIDDNGDRYGISNALGKHEQEEINNQQKIEFTDFEKKSLNVWWDSGHVGINKSLYGTLAPYEKEDKTLMNKLRNAKKGISTAINKTEGLTKPMVLYHGGRFDGSLNPGDHMTFKGYTSLSFLKKSAEEFDGYIEFGKALYVCYTPAQLKGICGNDKRLKNFYATEHEYLTDKNMGATILNIDYDNNIVEVLIDES